MMDFRHRWVLLVVAPCETPSFQLQWRKLQIVYCILESVEHPDVYPIVVFIFSSINEVKVSYDEPRCPHVLPEV
jgi:hypothetical protein